MIVLKNAAGISHLIVTTSSVTFIRDIIRVPEPVYRYY